MSFYTPSHLNYYQPHINLLIMKNSLSYKPLVKISAFWFSYSIFKITDYFPTIEILTALKTRIKPMSEYRYKIAASQPNSKSASQVNGCI